MSTLITFHQRVSRAIKRGNNFDGDIPGYAKDAVKTLEDMHDWKHMWTESLSQTLASGTNVVSLTDAKNVRYIRFHVDRAGIFNYMKKVSADQILYIDDPGSPAGFYMSAQNTATLDAKPSQAMTYDVGYYKYSDYDDDLAWLDIAENLLIAQTVVEMAPLLKDDKTKARFETYAAGRVQALIEAGLTHEYDGQQNEMIPYADDMDDWLLTGATNYG